jgi:site-specific DNA-cytosine methylase
MKIIYLASFKAHHPGWNMVYQDINGLRDIDGDMMEVDLDPYDVIVATPPCNYWSRANYRRELSKYSQKTKHLLPSIINKLCNQNKPFIVENVRNKKLMEKYNLFNFNCHIIEYGRHTYWTNILFNPTGIVQVADFIPTLKKIGDKQFLDEKTGKILRSNCTKRVNENSEGGDNVHHVLEYWLKVVKAYEC